MKALFIFLILLCASVSAKDVMIIAHRGNSSEAPENTIAAFLSAGRVNADYIECDVHLNKDLIPVIIHDRLLCRTAKPPYPQAIESTTLDELKTLDAGSWFSQKFADERIPTLADLLETEIGDTGVMVEIKQGSAPNAVIAQKVMEAINRNTTKTVIIGSRSPEILSEVRKIAPLHPIIGIVESLHDLKSHRANRPDFYALDASMVSSEIVRVIHDEGRLIWVWTVDNPDQARRFAGMEVDGIITNRPREMRHAGIYSEAD
jgi:glycerophosphoryl diester phosphodiesterase